MIIRRERGQASVEMVLMLVLMVGVMAFVSTTFRQNEIFASLVSGPWKQLSGLIQNGAWGDPESTMTIHPNRQSRVSSVRGDLVE
ncbi:MAG: hypothetical protein KDD38_03060 [Bdellovibrionales bacterium]|nr:hypothetical protein [Bdellovibrionales bacterium]